MKLEMVLRKIDRDLLLLRGLLLFAVIFITACNSEQIITKNPQLLPTIAPNMDYATRLAPSATATTPPTATSSPISTNTPAPTATPTATPTPTHPLMIEVMRRQEYPGSPLTIERELSPGSNFSRFLASYQSEGNRIFALLTVPKGEIPPTGWPVIIFNHGYIPPDVYRTAERYANYVNGFARNGYIIFNSDYRGHGESEGRPTGAYGSPGYTIDVLNGLAAVKNLPDVDPDRIGMWGHSMGGYITLRAMVVSEEIKVGVIWGGVVASYVDLLEGWRGRAGQGQRPTPDPTYSSGRPTMLDIYGTPEENPEFWASISSNSYVADISGPLQLHHSTTDATVSVEFSKKLYEQVLVAGKSAELFLYDGDNHNISANFGTAMRRSVEYFDLYLKGEG